MKFIKIVFGSCLGALIAMFAVIGIMYAIGISVANFSNKSPDVSSGSVLSLDFNMLTPEKTNNVQAQGFELEPKDAVGVHDIVKHIKHAKDNSKIDGIYLESSMLSLDGSKSKMIRDALMDFKSDGKFIVAYGEMYSQRGYYLASTADDIILNPVGAIDFRGFSRIIPFYKKAMDKFGVDMKIYYAGNFKSATEPYRLEKMSEPSRLQTMEYLSTSYDLFLQDIEDARGLSKTTLKDIAATWKCSTAEGALASGMIDTIGYKRDATISMLKRMGKDLDKKLKLVSIQDYHKSFPTKSSFSAKNKVAVVYAEGTITSGENKPGGITDGDYVPIITKLKNDDKIKAMVLRVDSPGGSVLASENILDALEAFRDAGKPIIVSMGSLAASGGYYISCAADSIIAEKNTLTGSIGVFSMIPDPTELMTETIGITMDTIGTGPMASKFVLGMEWGQSENEFFQRQTDRIYQTFLGRVANARGMTKDAVHEVAQGRVWMGEKARTLGLVDQIGDLDMAIAIAREKIGVEDAAITEYPKSKDPFTKMIESFSNTPFSTDMDMKVLEAIDKNLADQVAFHKDWMLKGEPMIIMPFAIEH